MTKLPKKEELLKQNPKPEPLIYSDKTGEGVAVKQAKDGQLIAEAENKKIEAEIKTKIAKDGYQNYEQAKANIELKAKEIDTKLKSVSEIEEAAIKIKEEAEQEKQKAIHALEVLRERTESVNARLEKAVTLERGFNTKDDKYRIAKQELQELIDYHKSHIAPCVKSLRAVSQAIYTWIDLLNTTNYDFTQLYNYIGKVTRVLDNYLDQVPQSIPRDILEIEAENEQD